MDSFGQSGGVATLKDKVARDGLWLSHRRGKGSKTARKTPNQQLAVTVRNCVTLDGGAAAFAIEVILPAASIQQFANTIDSHYIDD